MTLGITYDARHSPSYLKRMLMIAMLCKSCGNSQLLNVISLGLGDLLAN